MKNEVELSARDKKLLHDCKGALKKREIDFSWMSVAKGGAWFLCLSTAIMTVYTPWFLAATIPFFCGIVALSSLEAYKKNSTVKDATNGKFTYRQYKKFLKDGIIDEWERENAPYYVRKYSAMIELDEQKTAKYSKKINLGSKNQDAVVSKSEKENTK